jgi:hypothetical protein
MFGMDDIFVTQSFNHNNLNTMLNMAEAQLLPTFTAQQQRGGSGGGRERSNSR